ncbi:hypothetical protein ABT095_21970 [Kitasatospora sp. NPDC002227]|uniref:hypothetical protein n=1 Tax=Kitasatospora sp. NPDC002227 TaxID=3154773 RepID=UPI003333939E
MSAQDWPVPGWNEHEWLRSWFEIVFHPELINGATEQRELLTPGTERYELIRQSFEFILERQPFGVVDWSGLTRWSFQTEKAMYGFLLDLYNYVFTGSEKFPHVPEYDPEIIREINPPWISLLKPTPCDIPGWCESEEIREFYMWAFHPRVVKYLDRYWTWARRDDLAPLVRAGLEYLIGEKPFSVKEWKLFTESEFASEAELYAFLVDLYEYFYDEEPPRHAPA